MSTTKHARRMFLMSHPAFIDAVKTRAVTHVLNGDGFEVQNPFDIEYLRISNSPESIDWFGLCKKIADRCDECTFLSIPSQDLQRAELTTTAPCIDWATTIIVGMFVRMRKPAWWVSPDTEICGQHVARAQIKSLRRDFRLLSHAETSHVRLSNGGRAASATF